jgi:hypothetical protein
VVHNELSFSLSNRQEVLHEIHVNVLVKLRVDILKELHEFYTDETVVEIRGVLLGLSV